MEVVRASADRSDVRENDRRCDPDYAEHRGRQEEADPADQPGQSRSAPLARSLAG
jgi:hypothetical protein